MQKKTTAHIISHTHWDREWYLPYEKHHVLLIALMDTLLATLEKDSEYQCFHLDGQTIILEDYLQVRPEKKELLEAFIRDGRIHIGPWYILQDAFLTSSEANLRNLQIGHRDARQYGTIAKVGYFPDTFGNIGQAPQILRQAGIENAVFGRGVKPTGFNNSVADVNYESPFSELIWEGPDGSRVLGILFANWYHNGMEVPVAEQEARDYWERKLAAVRKYASTGELLFMNGCDHQPIQQDLSEAIRTARRLFPDVEFVHSSFPDYLKSLTSSISKPLSVVKGELRSQRTDGWSTLVNTASSRVYLKQMNQYGQALLEKVAEPLASYAYLLGQEYPQHLFTYAWKTLMQNHPHDSICGCSSDEVHHEMVTRFQKSRHVAETIIDTSTKALAESVNTSKFAQYGQDALPVVVFNSTGWERSGTVTVELEVSRVYFHEGIPRNEMNRRIKEIDIEDKVLIDQEGNRIAFSLEDLGLQFGYDLPDDKFRQPYMCRKVKIAFETERIPALGLKTYALVRSGGDLTSPRETSSLVQGERIMENGFLRVQIENDGSLTVTDKANGHSFTGLCVYEDTGDIGNEYMYKQPDGECALTTKGMPAKIRVLEDLSYRAAFEIVHEWQVPASADELLAQEQQEMVFFAERRAQRVQATVPLTIRTIVSLDRSGKGVEIEASFNNQAKDHRLRALFPTDLKTSTHRADSIFEIAVRDNEPSAEWRNPSNCQHQQAFADISSTEAGLTIANLGLHEYEVVRDGRNTIAVTLLRAVGELGDWGVFPTPEAQCIGEHTVRMKIIPHNGDGSRSGAFAEAYQFQVPRVYSQTGVHQGTIPPIHAPLRWEGSGLAFSSMKIGEDTGDLLVRWFNMEADPTELTVLADGKYGNAYKSNVLEQRGSPVHQEEKGRLRLPVTACEIVTLGIHVRK